MNAAPLGIVAGTGFYDLAALQDPRREVVDTDYGQAAVTSGTWHGLPVVFLTRHGAGHSVPPHLVNYRANIQALRDLGCLDVVAVNVTGGIDPDLEPGALLCLNDFLDFTKARIGTFHDGAGPEGVVHVDVVEAYHPSIRREILAAAATLNEVVRDEVTLAVEAGLRYAALSLVVNPAAGVGSGEPITMDEINAVLAASSARVLAILNALVLARAAA